MSLNSRKAAKTIPATISRLLKSGYLKNPPAAFEPILSHPPPPSLVRSSAPRTAEDLPPRAKFAQLASASVELPDAFVPGNKGVLNVPPAPRGSQTRKRPPRPNTKKVRLEAIVFPEDKIRKRFFKDHPFEAYRPAMVVERDVLEEEDVGPSGKAWTELRQRTVCPNAEDAISFIAHLRSTHELGREEAYQTGVAQFRTLRSEHEVATRAAVAEAQSYGAVFHSEVERGVMLEDQVLDRWEKAREIQAKKGWNSDAPVGFMRPQLVEDGMEDEQQQYALTGGVEYMKQYRERGKVATSSIENEP